MRYKVAISPLIGIMALIAPAYAETITTLVTSCTTKEAIAEYVQKTYIERKPAKVILDEINKNGEVCKIAMTVFDEVKELGAISKDGVKYTIVEIKTVATLNSLASGLSEVIPLEEIRYVMRFKKIEGTET